MLLNLEIKCKIMIKVLWTLDKHATSFEPEFNANLPSSPSYAANKFAKYALFSSMFQVTGLHFR